MVPDAQGSPVFPDPPVPRWDQTFTDLLETQDSLDWMENLVSRVLQVLPVLLVPAQLRETEETLDSQVSQDPPGERETLVFPEAPDSSEAPGSKEE